MIYSWKTGWQKHIFRIILFCFLNQFINLFGYYSETGAGEPQRTEAGTRNRFSQGKRRT